MVVDHVAIKEFRENWALEIAERGFQSFHLVYWNFGYLIILFFLKTVVGIPSLNCLECTEIMRRVSFHYFTYLFSLCFRVNLIYTTLCIYIYPELRTTRDRLLIKALSLCSPANVRFVDMLSLCSPVLLPLLSRAPSTHRSCSPSATSFLSSSSNSCKLKRETLGVQLEV